MSYALKPIGVMHSCFKEKFGIPSQAGLANSARGWVEFNSPYDREEAFLGLENYSHVWLIFLFHHSLKNEIGLTVQPPRREGEKYGLFATRSPNRPNQIGQSVVEIDHIEHIDNKVHLHVKGADLVEGTPILDVKPYVPYVDAISDARGGFAQTAPKIRFNVTWSSEAKQQLNRYEADYVDLYQLIVEVLQYDPRPLYYRKGFDKKRFGVTLYDLNILFDVLSDDQAIVVGIEKR